MDDSNQIYFLPENREHPLVRGEYAICTAPILEMFDSICQWIDSHASGGYIYGFSRYGKSTASRFWITKLLAERYGKSLAFFRLIYKQHDRFSESLFLSELLGASQHPLERAPRKNVMLERISRQYATSARSQGGDQIVLLVDEAQEMHEPEYQTLCNLENELDQLGFNLTILSVGSHELTYQHQLFVQTGKIHLTARYMVRSSRFRGIRNKDELEAILRAYDILTEWPEGSGRSYTKHFFPHAFESGFRVANLAEEMWSTFVELGPHITGYRLEAPMEHIAKTVEYLFRSFSDDQIDAQGVRKENLTRAVANTEYQGHMAAISYMLKGSIKRAQ
jgi:AAA domain